MTKEPYEVLTENASEVIFLLGQLTAAMDNTLLSIGHHMHPADAVARRNLVEQAEKLVLRLDPPEDTEGEVEQA